MVKELLKFKGYLVIIIITIILFLAVLISFFLPQKKQLPPPSPSPEPQSPPLLFEDNSVLNQPEIKNFNQIKVGQTRDLELATLPDLKNQLTLPNGNKQFSFSSPDKTADNLVITKNSFVAFKSLVTVTPNTWQHPKLSNYLSLYSPVERVATGSARFGKFATTYVIPSKGVALIANPFTQEVYELQNFSPTTLSDYLATWGKDLLEYKPDPGESF